MTKRLPTYFISHGGGPWPWLPDMRAMLRTLEISLAAMSRDIGGAPKAVLMISGHWEGPDFAVMASAHPPMVYDYYGFPPETYKIVYPAPGAPNSRDARSRCFRARICRPIWTNAGGSTTAYSRQWR